MKTTKGSWSQKSFRKAVADKAGLRHGDVIQKVDARSVKKRDHIVNLVSKKDPGDVVSVDVLRKSQLMKFRVTLGHRSVTFDLFNCNLQMRALYPKEKTISL